MLQPGFSQLHIDVARFATDDFNPFHDARKWHRLRGNPFGGPIVLGFQTATWIAERVRPGWAERDLDDLPWVRYQLTFAAALRPGQPFELVLRPARHDPRRRTFDNRVLLKSGGRPVLTGRFGRAAGPPADLDGRFEGLAGRPDRSEDEDGWFLKRKFMMTANAKNFLLGCQVDPAAYFDELEDRVRFPFMFPLSYISCALLERARKRGHDFEAEPMVYTRHEVALDLRVAGEIRSNDRLHLLVRPAADPETFDCLGLIDDTLLFRARIGLVPLARIAAS